MHLEHGEHGGFEIGEKDWGAKTEVVCPQNRVDFRADNQDEEGIAHGDVGVGERVTELVERLHAGEELEHAHYSNDTHEFRLFESGFGVRVKIWVLGSRLQGPQFTCSSPPSPPTKSAARRR